MYTQQIKRNKGNVFMQMHTIGTNSNLGITKLGSSLITTMQSLQNKKQQILKTNNVSKLPGLISDFKNQHKYFIQLQKNLFELDQTTPEIQRLKCKIKQFLQNIKVQEVQNKLENLLQEKVRENERLQIMNKVQKNTSGSVLKMDNKQLIRQRLLDEQSEQVKTIEKLIVDIKNIAIKTSSLIYEQGVNLNIAAQTIKSAKQKFKAGKDELIEANKYQQDTNKKKIFMCLVIVIIVIILLMIIIASSKKT